MYSGGRHIAAGKAKRQNLKTKNPKPKNRTPPVSKPNISKPSPHLKTSKTTKYTLAPLLAQNH
jgi:hypothetical protein